MPRQNNILVVAASLLLLGLAHNVVANPNDTLRSRQEEEEGGRRLLPELFSNLINLIPKVPKWEFLQVLAPSAFGGGCGAFQGCQEGYSCVDKVPGGTCLPVGCFASVLQTYTATKQSIFGDAPLLVQDDSSFSPASELDAETTAIQQLMGGGMDINKINTLIKTGLVSPLVECPGVKAGLESLVQPDFGDLDDILNRGNDTLLEFVINRSTPFAGVGFEAEFFVSLYRLYLITLGFSDETSFGSLLRMKCESGGFGANAGVFAMAGALFTRKGDPRGEWTTFSILDIIPIEVLPPPLSIDIPLIFLRYNPDSDAFEFGVAIAGGLKLNVLDIFRFNSCEVEDII